MPNPDMNDSEKTRCPNCGRTGCWYECKQEDDLKMTLRVPCLPTYLGEQLKK